MSNQPDPVTLAAVYNLTAPLYIERIEQNVYVIQGAGHHFALKVYPHGSLSSEGQTYQHWLLSALEKIKLPFDIPTPISNHQGNIVYTAGSGATWVLTRYVVGKSIQPNDPDHAYAAGNALAELHCALSKMPPRQNPNFPEYHFHARTLPHSRADLPPNPADLGLQDTREAQHRLRRFNEMARRFQIVPPAPYDELHWHIIHGDFSGANLVYDGERVVGVLDFELAHPDYRVREFAETLMRLATDPGALFWATGRAFADGYHEKLALTRAEIELVPRFIVERCVEQVIAYYVEGQPVHAAEALRQQEEISTWLESEQSRLMAMLRGVFLGE